jgi:putative transposase
MRYQRQSHAVFYTRYHIVFGTKYRRKIFRQSGMAEYMKVIMTTIQRRHPEITFHEVNTDQDHIHVLASISPKISICYRCWNNEGQYRSDDGPKVSLPEEGVLGR